MTEEYFDDIENLINKVNNNNNNDNDDDDEGYKQKLKQRHT
jgi:hypothetical protein